MIIGKIAIAITMQTMLAVMCISRKKKILSYILEVIVPVAFLCMEKYWFSGELTLDVILFYCALYLISKVLTLLIVMILKKIAFEITCSLTSKSMIRRKSTERLYKIFGKKNVQKFIKRFRMLKYGPNLKLGVPAMVNKTHKETGVKFDKKGFPIFKSYCTVILKRKYIRKSREVHFYNASKELYKRALSNKKLASRFTKSELSKFGEGDVPKRFTWHHHQDTGKLQLVEYNIHSKVPHIGGFSIWGKQ